MRSVTHVTCGYDRAMGGGREGLQPKAQYTCVNFLLAGHVFTSTSSLPLGRPSDNGKSNGAATRIWTIIRKGHR